MKSSILFACIGNSCRSQIAEGFMKYLSNNSIIVQSAGTKPETEINPLAIQVMNEIGLDISDQKPKMITYEMMKNATHFIALGCGVQEACPVPISVPNVDDWGLEDPWGKDIELFREIRDKIKEKIKKLLKNLS